MTTLASLALLDGVLEVAALLALGGLVVVVRTLQECAGAVAGLLGAVRAMPGSDPL